MDKSVASRPGWEMMSGFPPCTCATKPEQLPSELAPGVPRACNHLYVKKSADKDLFQISLSPGTSVGSPSTSSEKEKPQGVCVLRGGPVSIVIYPMPPGATNDTSPTTQSGPAFASLADERAADDMGVLLMGGQSRANSSSSSRRRIIRRSGRSSPLRRSRYLYPTLTYSTVIIIIKSNQHLQRTCKVMPLIVCLSPAEGPQLMLETARLVTQDLLL
jgi:hypothetical protein